jgi:hypothetical protein
MEAAGDGGAVILSPGNYGDQTVSGGTGSRPKGTLFVAEAGAQLHTLNAHLDRAVFSGFRIDAGGDKVLALDLSGDYLGLSRSRVGNVTDEKGAILSGSHITIDDTVFADVVLSTAGANAGLHTECAFAVTVPYLTVKNSQFTNCATMDLFFTHGLWWNPVLPAYGHVTLENNHFAASKFANGVCCHYYGLYVRATGPDDGGHVGDWSIRRNVFDTPAAVDPPDSLEDAPACGNSGFPSMPASWKDPC